MLWPWLVSVPWPVQTAMMCWWQSVSAVQDPCHDLAWILDAAIAHSRDAPEQGQQGGVLKPAHMTSLKRFFRDFDNKACIFLHTSPAVL